MTRYEQWRANPSSVQQQFRSPQRPASNQAAQPLVAHRSIHSHGRNTPSSSSTPSSSRSRASIPPRSRTPSPYRRGSYEEDRVFREFEDMVLRDEPRQDEESYPADASRSDFHAREDDNRRRREWEEEGQRRMTDQRRQEQDGILRRQREADLAAQAARAGQPTGQNQSVTTAPISASMSYPTPIQIQYPSVSGPASVSSGPITGQMQMPLESPTRCVN
ncbi:hypothetical protein BC827DRAFT_879728 [Russula dissimulans]|nr:hypothetical protein BC827DRAFT_879728 [Russula dissimulans]